uniref:Kinesin-like protein 6 n=1 Tax=Ciona savignyi TaxID=51511 RepID=H2YJV4_CIOSA
MGNNTTIIRDPEERFAEKKFTFDFSYWSHDGYREREDGYLEPIDNRYADQAKVFDDLGRGVLENAWKGFNCSLFAYGQTGSGKSYSMVGFHANKGIIPITCEELFKGISERKATDELAKEAEYQVSVSMLEIYNETVKDLLNVSSFKKGGLKVIGHRHPCTRFLMEQLQVSPVSDYAAVEGRIAEGTRNRTLAATNMNATSSRAHTIVAINFAQKAKNEAGKSMTKTSIINLVDLAGSERADSTGATGDRLKEGSMINKSLLCLGNCIKALADIQDGKHINVPFRDSILTRLLKNALGGNSKTIMIAALSPADINYEETLSTLRFADRAKSIKTKAVVNESPTDKLIREMKGEIKRLQGNFGGPVIVQGISPEEVEEMRRRQEEELLRNQEEMEQMKLTWQQRLEEQSQANQLLLVEERSKQEARKTTPHLWNLNEDPMLTGMIVHLTPPGDFTIGNSAPATIVLKGLSVLKDHALIENEENSHIYLSPVDENCKVLVNGKVITEKTELLMFGSNHLYVFHHPQDAARQEKEGTEVKKVSFNTAQEEIAKNIGYDMDKTGKSNDDIQLQEDLLQIMPLVNEANAMSEELDQRMLYEIALISPQVRGLKDGKTEVSIKAKYMPNDSEYMWHRNNFIDRKYRMQDMYQRYVDEEDDWDKTEDGNPFLEEDNPDITIGSSYLYLQSLAYLMDMEDNVAIRSYRGNEVGLLSIEAQPCSQDGSPLVDECVEDPTELVGQNLQFKIKVKKALDIPDKYDTIWCRYKFPLGTEWNNSTTISATVNPEFNYEEMFKAFPVTQQLLDEFENTPVIIQIRGKQKTEGDSSRAGLNTKQLLAMEKNVLKYKADEKELRHQHSFEPAPLKRRDSEMRHLHTSVTAAQEMQRKLSHENAELRKTIEINSKQKADVQSKLDLIAALVVEARQKGEPTILAGSLKSVLDN